MKFSRACHRSQVFCEHSIAAAVAGYRTIRRLSLHLGPIPIFSQKSEKPEGSVWIFPPTAVVSCKNRFLKMRMAPHSAEVVNSPNTTPRMAPSYSRICTKYCQWYLNDGNDFCVYIYVPSILIIFKFRIEISKYETIQLVRDLPGHWHRQCP